MQLKTYCPYPVGEIRLSVDATDPASLWPGTTWERIQDCMLMLAGSTYAAGSSGGAASHTLTVDEMPSHKHQVPAHGHGFTQPTVPAHNHGLNGHTHTYAKPNSPTGGTAITEAQLASHKHKLESAYAISAQAGGSFTSPTSARATSWGWYTENTGSGSAHTHTVGTTSTSTGGNSGNTADKAAFACTGGAVSDKAAFDTGNAGGGSSFSILNPYLAVYGWKRVA